MTTLTTVESLIRNQDRLNGVTPTLYEILESGKKFKWGLDLDLVDKRRHTVRSQNISAEDVTNYITMLQKVINSPANPAYKVNYDRVKRITKLSDEQLRSLPDLETAKKGQDKNPASSNQTSGPKSGNEALLVKAKLDRDLSVNKCKCLVGLLETHIKLLPSKKGVFSRGGYTQAQAYDLVNAMKIETNKTLTQANKEINYFEHLTSPAPVQENAFKQGMQEQLKLLDMNCAKQFTDLSKSIKKVSKDTILEEKQCIGLPE